jgi:hypothetical protein
LNSVVTRRAAVGLVILAVIGASPAFEPGHRVPPIHLVGHPHLVGPPLGHTGGFGEPTCRICHLGLALNDPRGSIEVGGLEGTFEPGGANRIRVTLRGEGMGRAGFQATFRLGEGSEAGSPAGRVVSLDEYTLVTRDPETGVEYIQHTEAGAALVDGLGRWVFDWIAPEGDEAVVLHITANSANGDDSPLEDLIYQASLELRSRQ